MANLVELESPPPVPWWPPAPGWYVLAALILLIGLSVAWRAFRRWRANAYRREGLRLVRASASKPSGAALDTIACVLKRVAMQTYGRSRVAQLAGRQWLEFLDRTGRTSAFSNGVGQRLTDARYSSNSDQVDPAKLKTVIDVAATWIRRHRPAAEPKR